MEHIYQKKTQLEHILLRPDTYIGSVELVTQVGAGLNPREPLASAYKAQNICLSITKHLLYKRMAQKKGCTWALTNSFSFFFFQQMWVYDEGVGLNCRDVTFVPGLYKIFDEILGKLTDLLSP